MIGSETATCALGSGANRVRGRASGSGLGDAEKAEVHGDSMSPETDGCGVVLESSELEASGFGEQEPEGRAVLSDCWIVQVGASVAVGTGEEGLEDVGVLSGCGALDGTDESSCSGGSEGSVVVTSFGELDSGGADNESASSMESGGGDDTPRSVETEGTGVFSTSGPEPTELTLSDSWISVSPPMSLNSVVLLSSVVPESWSSTVELAALDAATRESSVCKDKSGSGSREEF